MLDNQSHTDNTSTLKSADTYLPVFFWAQCVDSSGMFISFFVMLGKIIYRVLLLRSHEYGAWAKCYSHSEVEELKKSISIWFLKNKVVTSGLHSRVDELQQTVSEQS